MMSDELASARFIFPEFLLEWQDSSQARGFQKTKQKKKKRTMNKNQQANRGLFMTRGHNA